MTSPIALKNQNYSYFYSLSKHHEVYGAIIYNDISETEWKYQEAMISRSIKTKSNKCFTL